MTKSEELRKLLDMIYELPNEMSYDRETGSHHMNNAASEKWAKENRYLLVAINNIIDFARSIDPS
jgi:hypothetical protein